MPTATKTAPSVEHAKLAQLRDDAYAQLQAVKRRHQAHDEQTEAMRTQMTERVATHDEEFEGPVKMPKPGTEAAKMRDQIMVRMRGTNPVQGEYDTALAKFHRHDVALRTWKLRNLQALLDERREAKDAAVQKIREAAAALVAGTREYATQCELDREDIIATGPLNAQDLRFDPRVPDWGLLAAEIRDAEILTSGLNDAAADRLAGFAEQEQA